MDNIVISLAAIAQAIKQVQQIAWKGNYDETQLLPLIESIFKLDSSSVNDIYSGAHNLNSGLRELRKQLSADSREKDLYFGRYLASILSVQKQFMAKPEMQSLLAGRIEHSRRLLDYDDLLSTAMFSSLAECYTQSISKLPTRIQVYGEPAILQKPEVQSQVRTLLLTAVRAAVLWRQVGGKKRQMLFNRQAIVDTADNLIKRAIH